MKIINFKKKNSLFNIISNQTLIKYDLYAKNSYEAKYEFLINKRESTGLKYLMVLKLIEYSNDMDGIYKNIGEMNLNKKHKILLVFDDTIADMLSNKRLNRIVAELSIKDRQLNISLVFITQSYFAVSQN